MELLTKLDLYEILHYVKEMGLGTDFYHPEFFGVGMLSGVNHIAIGFGFSCVKYMIRGDGTKADSVLGGCMCGKWLFYAYRYRDVFKAYDVICEVMVTLGTAITIKACRRTKENIYREKVMVLGPCSEGSYTWWAEQEDEMQNMVDILIGHFYINCVWPSMDQDE